MDDEHKALDANTIYQSYKAFPSFKEWKKCSSDEKRWQTHIESKRASKTLDVDVLRRARKIVSSTAAIESGAIEGLYDADRGFTFTVATEAALWETALTDKGSND